MGTWSYDFDRYHYFIVVPHIYEKLYMRCAEQWDEVRPIEWEELRLNFFFPDMQAQTNRYIAFLLLMELVRKENRLDYKVYFSLSDKRVRLSLSLKSHWLKFFIHYFVIFLYNTAKRIYVAYKRNKVTDWIKNIELSWTRFLLFFHFFPHPDYDWVRSELFKQDLYVKFMFVSNYKNHHATRLLASHYGIEFFV
jgi:hypothetical protein